MKYNQIKNRNEKIQEIKAEMHGLRDLRMFKRYQDILMHLKGRSYVEIAEFSGCTLQTEYNYVRTYKTKGYEPGAIPNLSPLVLLMIVCNLVNSDQICCK
ncbi:helix-turn-helix domain-containing protein [Bacillus sp. 2205SS5-2]|uniref:helix-turn-helix domain-containing protein n=1 Tax=Bacillus sp. 2205SS5-2 TaxID=3109031 RepID=UPI003007E991